jgi:glucose-1-phosphate adenylyltransferase
VAFEEKPVPDRLAKLGGSVPPGNYFYNRVHNQEKPFIASMGIYVFSREVLLDLVERTEGTDFGREIIPASLTSHSVKAYLHDDYWADVGTVESFYEANVMLTQPHAPFKFYDPRRPIYTHERFLPPSHMRSCTVRESLIGDGCFLDECAIDHSVVGIRTHVGQGSRIMRSVLLGADTYSTASTELPVLGIGRDVVLDRVIIDKNASIGDGARIVNEAGVQHADGDGYYIRSGIVIVPKGGHIAEGSQI